MAVPGVGLVHKPTPRVIQQPRAPTATDDKDQSILVGDLWIDTMAHQFYICVDDTVGAAIWEDGAGGGTGNVISDDGSTTLTYIAVASNTNAQHIHFVPITADDSGKITAADVAFMGTSTAGLTLKSLSTAERTSITPVGGELVYDTDTDSVWYGDEASDWTELSFNASGVVTAGAPHGAYRPIVIGDNVIGNGVDWSDATCDIDGNVVAKSVAFLGTGGSNYDPGLHLKPLISGENALSAALTTGGELSYNDSTDQIQGCNDAGTWEQVALETNTMTFTNKTINASSNSISNINASMIDPMARTGLDSYLVTGTAGAAPNLANWNSDGDLVDSGVDSTTILTASTPATLTNMVWNGEPIDLIYGGTGLTSCAQGDLFYGLGTDVMDTLPGNVDTQIKFLSQQGDGGSTIYPPAWTVLDSSVIPTYALTTTANENITLTLSGSPDNCLFADVGITVNWNDVLYSSRGGTNYDITGYGEGSLVYYDGVGLGELAQPGSDGHMFRSKSGGLAPIWSTPTWPNTASTGKLLIGDGTNWVESTPSFPSVPAASGKILQSDGTDWTASAPTYPATASSAGKIMVSDGSNFINSTPTFPNSSATSGKNIQSDGTNWVASTSTWPTGAVVGDVPYGSASNVVSMLAGNTTTTKKFLRETGTGTDATAPAWDTVTKTDVGLSNVENTALSTWAGSTSITTLGTITTGTWNGTAIDLATYVTGNLATSHLNSGTAATAYTFWRGDATWKEPVVDGFASFPVVTNAFYANPCANAISQGGGVVGANRLSFTPTMLHAGTAYKRLSVQVTTGFGAAANIRMGIYDCVSGIPVNLLVDGGAVDATTNGLKEVTINYTPTVTGWYFLAILNEKGTPLDIRAAGGAGANSAPGAAAMNGQLNSGMVAARTYASGFENPYTGSTAWVTGGATNMGVGIRVV